MKYVRIARPADYPLVVLSAPMPRNGDEPWWEQWVGAAAVAAKELQTNVLRNAKPYR